MIRIQGNQFEIGGEIRPYHFCSQFKWSSFFYAPHADLGKARASLQRAKSLGFDGIRVFDEHHDWVGNPFLTAGAAINTPWNLAQAPGSAFALSPAQKQAYQNMVDMLMEEGMYAELVINATIKSEPGFLDGKHEQMVAYWERMQRVVMQYLRELGANRLVIENCNEFTAHVPSEAYAYLRKDANGVDLIPRMAERARNQDYPGRPYGISDGGTWNPEVPGKYSHINVHSERGERWWDIHSELARLTAYYPAVPKTLNENMHGMSAEQWKYWVSQQHHSNPPKLAAQSRPDTAENVDRMRKQWEKAEDFGWSYCLHNCNGIFSDPDLPLDGFEAEWARTHGGGPIPPPPERMKYEGWVKTAYREVLDREADPGGLAAYNGAIERGELAPTELYNVLLRSKEYLSKPELWDCCYTPVPPPPVPPPPARLWWWRDVADTRFGEEPHPSATFARAIKATDQQLIWDGVRNPSYALRCPEALAAYGETEDHVMQTIGECQDALFSLRAVIELDDNWRPIGGVWEQAAIDLDEFFDLWHTVIIPAQRKAEKLNGIKGKAQELCG